MTRLQKKCLIAAAGTHLLVVVVVLCSGFITSKPKQDDTQVLDVIPSVLIDAAFNSGVKNPPTPPPTRVVKPVDPPPPIVDPPKPTPPPEPVKIVEPVKPPEDVKPVKDPEISIPPPKPPKKHEVKVDLKPAIRDNNQAKKEAAEAAAKAERDAQRKKDDLLRTFRTAANSIKNNSSSATTVDMPGTSSVSYANYASYVKTVYERDWTPPDDTASDDANVKVSVTISRDGTVAASRILNPSGDKKVDASVQRTLDHIDFIRAFPADAKEKEKTFIINFNLKAKRMLG